MCKKSTKSSSDLNAAPIAIDRDLQELAQRAENVKLDLAVRKRDAADALMIKVKEEIAVSLDAHASYAYILVHPGTEMDAVKTVKSKLLDAGFKNIKIQRHAEVHECAGDYYVEYRPAIEIKF